MQPVHPSPLTRRVFFTGTCGAACTLALSACVTYQEIPARAPAPAPAPGTPGAQGAPAPSGALAGTSDIPVGGGAVFAEQDVVVTQPEAGEFRAFSATCTHQGCPVTEVVDGTINCNCHGSKFAVEDGSVVDGPADSPLPEREISVAEEQIRLA